MAEEGDVGAEVVEGIEEGLINLWKQEADLHQVKPGVYYPSMIGSCLRRQHYAYTLGETPDAERLAVFATGRGVHDAVAEALESSGRIRVEAKEVEVSLGFGEATLHGRVDLLIASTRGERFAVEVKSTSRIPEQPFPHHVLQLQAYLHATKLRRGVIVYWDKRTGAKKGFTVQREDSYFNTMGTRLLELHTSLREGRPPRKEAFLENRLWECYSCAFIDECKPFLIEGVEIGPVTLCDLELALLGSRERLKRCLREVGLSEDAPLRDLRGEQRKRFWELFFSEEYLRLDSPVKENIARLRERKDDSIVILTGRPERLRRATEKQLQDLGVPFKALLMRRDNDYSTERRVKEEWIDNLRRTGYTPSEHSIIGQSPTKPRDEGRA